ncbi:MAG: undecaprenyldiphospho-muramoylpentapeptide beta-N-acetylglucosaminyltransferase [Armatimonadota bacterium]|nr:undecaprenyldiphospho-muramoylpentapeptide beta-N-acetylglucosaminyltransferase [Armatimonadota bacterium]
MLTGGGTGGHAYPAVAIAEALREIDPSVELLFVGSRTGPESRIAAEADISFRSVPCAPFPRSLAGSDVVGVAKIIAGFVVSLAVLRRFGPDVAVGTGGYTTVPVLLAQRTLGKPIVIHEQNAVAGRANLFLARFARRVCVTFPSSVKSFPRDKTVVTGLPIRKKFFQLPTKAEARAALGMHTDCFTILVVGGSLGARRLNDLMFEVWPKINDGATQVLHQVGASNMDQAERIKALGLAEYGGNYRVEPFVDMPVAMAAADLLVGRSGASTLAEATAAGLPCILIPYPHAAADEQTANARYLAEHGAAIVFRESELTPQELAAAIIELRSSPDRLRDMSEASRALGTPNAAREVAEIVAELAQRV